MARLIGLLLPAVLLVFPAAHLCAAEDGQEDLNKAVEAKLNAATTSDLDEVIRLSESALEKGLDQANTDFANKLLCSTLFQRASEMAKRLLVNLTSDDDFRRRRRSIMNDLLRVVKLDPKQSQAYVLIAQLNLLPEGDVKQAREALDKAIEVGIDEAPTRAKALVWRASLQEQPEKRLADCDEALRLAPDDAAVVHAHGVVLADLGKLEAALADFDKAIELAPKDASTYVDKAKVLARLKKYDAALAALEKAQQFSPNSVSPLETQARVHVEQKNLEAAVEDLNQALAIEPNNMAMLMLRAGVYQLKGDVENALKDVDQVLRLRPNLPLAIRTRALLLAEGKRYAEAAIELEKLRKINPKDRLTLLQLGTLYAVQKKSAEAIEAYSALLAQTPDEWQALQGRADLYLNTGKHAEAVADYDKAVKLCPRGERLEDSSEENSLRNVQSLLNNFAWVLATSPDEKLRDGKRAIELATEAAELSDYKLAYILSTLAAAYAETGDFDTAIKWSSKAVEVGDPQHDESLKKELESYKAKKPWREMLPEDEAKEKKDKAADNP